MGQYNQTQGARRRKAIELPEDACYFALGFGRDSGGSEVIWIFPTIATRCVEWWVPEFLLDRRGHNTNICHAKYKSGELPITVIGNARLAAARIMTNGDTYTDCSRGICWSTCWSVTGDKERLRITCDYSFCYGGYGGRAQRYYRCRTKTTWSCDVQGQLRQVISNANFDETIILYPNDEEFPRTEASGKSLSRRLLVRDDEPLTKDANRCYVSFARGIRVEVPVLSNPAFAFRLNEPNYERGRADLHASLRPAMEEAYKRAAQQFPKTADNNIANAIEIGELIVDALRGNAPQIPKHIRDLWMWYRYTFSTAASDTKQAIKDWARIEQGVELGREYHGSVFAHIDDINAQVRWSGMIGLNTDDLLALTSHRLWAAGLEPSAYIGWDLLPFSFVVDWFVDVGGKLEEEQEDEHLFRDYIVNHSCYSVSYDVDTESAPPVNCYYRFYHPPVQSNGELFLQTPKKASLLTWSKRGMDLTALGAPVGGKVSKGVQTCIRVLR